MTSQNHSPDTLTSMPRSWYDVPESAAAIFSTRNQTLQKRRLVDPLPPPVIRSELLVDVQNKAALLRHQFPDLILQVRTPQTWNDLYRYFDGVDLWTETPTFLFHVITSISNTNKAIEHEQSVMIDIFGAEWVASNEELVAHTPDSKDVATLFTQAEWDYETSGMNDQELITLRKALNFYAQIPRQKLRQAESRRLQNYLIAPSHHMSSLQVYHTLGPALPAAREQAYPVPPQVHAYPAVAKPHAVIDKTPITERPDLCRNQTASCKFKNQELIFRDHC
jgi:hypothetical protein